MDRRAFLKSTALLAGTVPAAALLAACGDDAPPAAGASDPAAPPDNGPLPDGPASLAPVIASFELLTTLDRPVPFGLRTLQNEEVPDADVEVYLRDLAGEVLGGPFPATYTEETGAGGLYLVELELSQPGQVEFVAVAGDRYGTQAVNVVTPEQSQAPVAGDEATSVATPTLKKDLGVAEVCTQDPPCGMHKVSLDTALEAGKPVMVLFATPAYCQTAVCGPAVGTVDDVRTGGDWGETTWIHVEIYSDAGQTLTDAVKAWELPTEPWLFSIGKDGKIVDRLDGPMLPDTVEQMATQLQSA